MKLSVVGLMLALAIVMTFPASAAPRNDAAGWWSSFSSWLVSVVEKIGMQIDPFGYSGDRNTASAPNDTTSLQLVHAGQSIEPAAEADSLGRGLRQ